MAIYAIPETAHITDPADPSPYLTPGKRYPVRVDDAPDYFDITDDDGDALTCFWEGCCHGGNWTRVEVDDEDDSVIVSRPAVPADEPADTTGLDLTGSETLKLVPAGNGGWVVYRVEAPHLHDPLIGAYSSAEDMCAALTEALA